MDAPHRPHLKLPIASGAFGPLIGRIIVLQSGHVGAPPPPPGEIIIPAENPHCGHPYPKETLGLIFFTFSYFDF